MSAQLPARGGTDPPPPMDALRWHTEGWVVVAADRSLGSVLLRARDEQASWVVVVRTLRDGDAVFHYAYRVSELEQFRAANPTAIRLPLEEAMGLMEVMSSETSRSKRLTVPALGGRGPAARVVDFDAGGRLAGIGEIPTDETRGPHRAALRPEPPPAAQNINVTVSAKTKAEIDVGAETQVSFRIELTAKAKPLTSSLELPVRADQPIVIALTAENDAVEIVGERMHAVDAPDSEQLREGAFTVKGRRPGVVRLAVAFRQGGSDLGVIGLAVEVVAAAPHAEETEETEGSVIAMPRDVADDDTLMLLVEAGSAGGQICYEYFLHSDKLGLIHRKRSKPLLDRGNGHAATMLAYVERIYEQVTQELRSLDDLKELERVTRALGAKLCRELFDPDVTKVLWPLRNRITQVQIVSWEPYIPWELVRLCDPDTPDIDDRFLAEYGLVRTLSDDMPPRELPMVDWGYLGATFPTEMLPAVGAEMEYFTGAAADGLRARKIQPRRIAATRDGFYDALGPLEFDVIHLSCHASSSHQSIERANLILGEETLPGAGSPRLVEVDAITVEAEARLKRRRPLVFLNACETARVGAGLTEWGGWPNVFLRAGAGAFVGAAWSVRDEPAATFATSFYNALLDGRTLAEAAGAARAAAKKHGDASWLAFKVYGHPRARRAAAP